MIDEAIMLAKKESLISLSSECEIPLDDLHKMVQPIIDSCTKDAISVSFKSSPCGFYCDCEGPATLICGGSEINEVPPWDFRIYVGDILSFCQYLID